ncbi:hypothetical protein F5Y19DRAFT_440812 [Xylariaceae sp. FL1651]|nr:hypothetical protein F5Y19DRAFT_440812 [Xylariaceae sp. FL1651]
MSFGWSAGDIATAVKIAYDVYEALDSCRGAAREYRDAVSFLRELIRTLEPLKTLAAWNTYPSYGKDIKERVDFIKGPIDEFLQLVLKYEPALGAKAREGHHRHIFLKLKWHFLISKEVLTLRNNIEPHIRVLDCLLQRMILDVVYATQQNLPNIWCSVFQQTIRPELITILQSVVADRGCPQSSDPGVPLELYRSLLKCVDELKQTMTDNKTIQLQLETFLNSQGCIGRQIKPAKSAYQLKQVAGNPQKPETCRNSFSVAEETHKERVRESLQEVYYLVLLYLGQFLKNLFLLLSQFVQPSKQLMPILIAKFNITFLDAVGGPSRVLPYEYFRNFQIFQVFIHQEFGRIPLIDRGRYVLLNMANNRALDRTNWCRYITPGSTVAMSALVRMQEFEQCPDSYCDGTLERSVAQTWATCIVCGKEVYCAKTEIGLKSALSTDFRLPQTPGTNFLEQLQKAPAARSKRPVGDIEGSYDDMNDDDDISIFKRIAREYDASASAAHHPDIESQAITDSKAPNDHRGAGPYGLDECRMNRIAELLSDFRTLQYYIAAVQVEPTPGLYNAAAWAILRQCAIDGQHIVQCPSFEVDNMDTELKLTLRDAYCRRHQSQKVYLKQLAAMRWIEGQSFFLQDQARWNIQSEILTLDRKLQSDLSEITDKSLYDELRSSDISMARWTAEDPNIGEVLGWLAAQKL